MHRFLRLSAFLAGLLVGGLSVLFAFDNQGRTALAVGGWTFAAIPLWAVAIVPLVVGIAAGYLYHAPARMHHFTEHMKHRSLVHELQKDKEELSRSLDRLLAMPNDDTPALAAAAAARDVTPASPGSTTMTILPQTTIVASAARPDQETAVAGNGHRARRSERRPPVRPIAAPEAMKEAIAAAAAAMPTERHARAPRPGRTRKTASPPIDPN